MSETETPSSPSAEVIAGNLDLLAGILALLPVKTLLRLKSVSKLFSSLISDQHFSLLHSRHHSHHPSSTVFFLHRHHNHHHHSFDFIPLSPPSSPPPFFKSSPHIHILQSTNGLLLCSPSQIINPTTNQFTLLPLPHLLILGLTLVFDPSKSDHFRVVCVSKHDNDDTSFDIHLYFPETNRWELMVDLFTAPFDVEFERGVYCDWKVYWLSHTDSTVVFDLGKGCVEDLGLPSSLEGVYLERFRYFGESCGHLHLIELRTNCVAEFDVLELDRREKNEWFVKYRVNLDVAGRGFEAEMFQDHSDRFHRRFRFYAFSILALVRGSKDDDDEDEDNSVLVISVPGKVISYNFKTKVSRLLSNVVDESDKWLPFKGYNAHQFIESLYCL